MFIVFFFKCYLQLDHYVPIGTYSFILTFMCNLSLWNLVYNYYLFFTKPKYVLVMYWFLISRLFTVTMLL